MPQKILLAVSTLCDATWYFPTASLFKFFVISPKWSMDAIELWQHVATANCIACSVWFDNSAVCGTKTILLFDPKGFDLYRWSLLVLCSWMVAFLGCSSFLQILQKVLSLSDLHFSIHGYIFSHSGRYFLLLWMTLSTWAWPTSYEVTEWMYTGTTLQAYAYRPRLHKLYISKDRYRYTSAIQIRH